MKKLLSVILAVITVALMLTPAVSAFEFQDIPIITMGGSGNCTVYDESGKQNFPNNYDLTENILKNKKVMAPLLAEFAKAIATNKWDKYCDMLVKELTPIWEDNVFSPDGNPKRTQVINEYWKNKPVNGKKSDYGIGNYYYQYDWRLDPYEIADDIHEYVLAVLDATGAKQVSILGRCLGAIEVAAYLDKYGDENLIDTAEMYCPLNLGNEQVDALFTGEINLNPDTVEMWGKYFAKYGGVIADDNISEFVAALVAVMNASGVLDLTAKSLVKFIANFKDKVLPPLLRASYASFPGYWAMISDEKYEQAKKYVFGGVEDEYSGLIEKIDNYHYNCQNRTLDILDNLKADYDMNVIVICKYGTPSYPHFDGADYQTDNSNSLEKQSFGATCSPINKTLSESYIAERTEAGYGKYISPDKKIDASTAHFADSTWFFKDVKHEEHHNFVYGLARYASQRTDQLTVFNDPGTVQFMVKNAEGNIVPLTEETNSSDEKWNEDHPIVSLYKMFKYLFKFVFIKLKDLISKE